MIKIKIWLISAILGICSTSGKNIDSLKTPSCISLKNYSIESLSAFSVGGIFTIFSVSSSLDNGYVQMGRNSLIAYSFGGPIGGSSAGMFIRNNISIKPIGFSTIGSLLGVTSGYFISKINVKAGEIATMLLVPTLSSLGVELAYCF